MEKEALKKLHDFFSGSKKLSFKKGETILRPDDESHGVFYLVEGYTRLYSISKSAQELTLIIYRPGEFFPLIPAVNHTPLTYYTEAITSVELYRVSQDAFIKFAKSNSEVMFEISAHILERFGGLLARMEHAMFGNAGSKVASIILICAERFSNETSRAFKHETLAITSLRLQNHSNSKNNGVPRKRGRLPSKNEQEIIISVPLTHQDIAKLIGMARETVSIEMKKLQRMGLIDYKGKYLVVKDYQKLAGESVLGPLD